MKVGFFEEKEGVKSSTRLNSFILLFALIGLDAGWLLYVEHIQNPIDANFIAFNFLVLIAIFTPKFLHKLAELK
ncbi:hypothetical protein LCGC14_3027840 [marine sediment metagenome]|uniref:Uncharacterized protein n=1 Tax=marine sediment metagenome TaxID=412755 RepID=A0A0F8XGG8_9ZZZZ